MAWIVFLVLRHRMKFDFVVGSQSSLLQGLFSGPPVFLSLQKQHSKFQFELETGDKISQLVECPLLSCHCYVYYCYNINYFEIILIMA